MSASGSKSSPSVGFLTVCEYEEQGLFGGYLVLNTTGRPLEFHCTAPIRPSRAQEILYGATLKPYLYGEQIGQALLEKARLRPLVVFTDVEPVLAVREFVDFPIALVVTPTAADDEPAPDAARQPRRTDAAHRMPHDPCWPALHRFSVGPRLLAVAPSHASDETVVSERWETYAAGFDLGEPFTRIREAIDEARRTAR
jgi:hypothetical protein